jgi:hypothetical protein
LPAYCRRGADTATIRIIIAEKKKYYYYIFFVQGSAAQFGGFVNDLRLEKRREYKTGQFTFSLSSFTLYVSTRRFHRRNRKTVKNVKIKIENSENEFWKYKFQAFLSPFSFLVASLIG